MFNRPPVQEDLGRGPLRAAGAIHSEHHLAALRMRDDPFRSGIPTDFDSSRRILLLQGQSNYSEN